MKPNGVKNQKKRSHQDDDFENNDQQGLLPGTIPVSIKELQFCGKKYTENNLELSIDGSTLVLYCKALKSMDKGQRSFQLGKVGFKHDISRRDMTMTSDGFKITFDDSESFTQAREYVLQGNKEHKSEQQLSEKPKKKAALHMMKHETGPATASMAPPAAVAAAAAHRYSSPSQNPRSVTLARQNMKTGVSNQQQQTQQEHSSSASMYSSPTPNRTRVPPHRDFSPGSLQRNYQSLSAVKTTMDYVKNKETQGILQSMATSRDVTPTKKDASFILDDEKKLNQIKDYIQAISPGVVVEGGTGNGIHEMTEGEKIMNDLKNEFPSNSDLLEPEVEKEEPEEKLKQEKEHVTQKTFGRKPGGSWSFLHPPTSSQSIKSSTKEEEDLPQLEDFFGQKGSSAVTRTPIKDRSRVSPERALDPNKRAKLIAPRGSITFQKDKKSFLSPKPAESFRNSSSGWGENEDDDNDFLAARIGFDPSKNKSVTSFFSTTSRSTANSLAFSSLSSSSSLFITKSVFKGGIKNLGNSCYMSSIIQVSCFCLYILVN
jgi:hypothetical protein